MSVGKHYRLTYLPCVVMITLLCPNNLVLLIYNISCTWFNILGFLSDWALRVISPKLYNHLIIIWISSPNKTSYRTTHSRRQSLMLLNDLHLYSSNDVDKIYVWYMHICYFCIYYVARYFQALKGLENY